jgi:hypothetical protein
LTTSSTYARTGYQPDQPGPARVGASSPVGYFSIEGAAGYASVSTKTIKRWIQAGLPVYQGTTRGKVLIRPTDIDGYLMRRQAPQVDLNTLVDDVLSGLCGFQGEGLTHQAKHAA